MSAFESIRYLKRLNKTMNNKKKLTHEKLLRDYADYAEFISKGIDGQSPFLEWTWSKVSKIVQDPMFRRIEQKGPIYRKTWQLNESIKNRQLVEDVLELFTKLVERYPRKKKDIVDDLDQFYTNPKVARDCYTFLKKHVKQQGKKYYYVEPSAGDGAFYNCMPPTRRAGIDLEPKCIGVVKQDFFDYVFPCEEEILTLGNPPFGKNASLAVKFFNRAASFSQVKSIAFIVPKTFKKVSIQNKLNLNFHLVKEMELDDESFLKDGQPYRVPCCFQIWERRSTQREQVHVDPENEWFTFVKKDKSPDLAVRRVGGKTGTCTDEIGPCKTHSFYFLKLKDGVSKERLQNHINKLQKDKSFLKIASNTAGVRSMSIGEFITTLKQNPL